MSDVSECVCHSSVAHISAAGAYTGGSTYRSGPAAQSRLYHPTGVVQTPDGSKIFWIDQDNNCVRAYDVATGVGLCAVAV